MGCWFVFCTSRRHHRIAENRHSIFRSQWSKTYSRPVCKEKKNACRHKVKRAASKLSEFETAATLDGTVPQAHGQQRHAGAQPPLLFVVVG